MRVYTNTVKLSNNYCNKTSGQHTAQQLGCLTDKLTTQVQLSGAAVPPPPLFFFLDNFETTAYYNYCNIKGINTCKASMSQVKNFPEDGPVRNRDCASMASFLKNSLRGPPTSTAHSPIKDTCTQNVNKVYSNTLQ